eukprot:COSAG02_NODE_28316_length_592_cov_0.521298_1_plen_108_part_00
MPVPGTSLVIHCLTQKSLSDLSQRVALSVISILVFEENQRLGAVLGVYAFLSEFYVLHKNPTQPVAERPHAVALAALVIAAFWALHTVDWGERNNWMGVRMELRWDD